MRNLCVYAQALSGRVLHVRDEYGLEVDAIVDLPDGTWAAFQVKLSGEHEDEAAANLHRFVDKIDTARTGEPAALVVITADRYGYRRRRRRRRRAALSAGPVSVHSTHRADRRC